MLQGPWVGMRGRQASYTVSVAHSPSPCLGSERQLLPTTYHPELVHLCPATCAKLQARSHHLGAPSVKPVEEGKSLGEKLGLGGEDVRKFVALESDRKGTSLMVQWLRICLPVQGTRGSSLSRKDPTC